MPQMAKMYESLLPLPLTESENICTETASVSFRSYEERGPKKPGLKE